MNNLIDICELDFIEEEIINIDNNIKKTFDLEIENVHYYILSNGIISHNTTSRLAGVSSGIEPNFAFEYTIHDRLGDRKEYHWLYKQRKELGLNDDLFICSSNLTPKQHIDMQSICQNYIDSSISKTINAPNDANIEDVKDLFMYAYDKGLKGITYFRDGSRKGVLRKIENEEKEQEVSDLEKMFLEAGDNVIKNNVKIPLEPPVKLYKRTDKNKKKWYFFIAFADRNCKKPFSFFIKTNNYAGSDVADWVISNMERLLFEEGINKDVIINQIKKYSGQNNVDKIARTISMALRHNIPILDIVKTIDCEIEFSSLLFHVKKILEMFIPDGTLTNNDCPECQSKLVYAEGCIFCPGCGFSKCG